MRPADEPSRPGSTGGAPISSAALWPARRRGEESLADRLVAIARAGHGRRPDDLLALDDRRLAEPDWFQRPDMLGYAAYADRFAGTLSDVGEHADYLADLGVTYLHLMPLLMPRPAPNDGGYAVADYRTVRPDLGTTTTSAPCRPRCGSTGSVSASTWC